MADLLPPVVATLSVNATQFEAGFTKASETVGAATKEIEAEIKRLDASFISIGQASEDAAVMNAASMEKMRADTAKLVASMEAAEVKAAAANEAMATKIDAAAASSTATTEGKIAALGKIGVGVAGAAAIIGVASVKMAADFEQATNRLANAAGESHNNIKMVGDGILDMAGQVGFTAQQLATAMYTVDSAGFHAADSLTILKASAQGAKIEQADLGTTVDAVTTSLVDYHQGADQASNVMSKLVTAVGEGKTNLQELAGSLHSVTPLASNLGITFDEVTAAVATMTVHGMSADQATQNLADTIRHLSNPTQVMVSEMGQLGLSAQTVAKQLSDPNVGLHGVLEEIYTTIMQHMGPAGDVLLGTFKQSAAATDDLNRMVDGMSGRLQQLSKQVMDGSIDFNAYKKDIKDLSPDLYGMGMQFLSLYERAHGFSDALKSGSPAAQEFNAALAKMMGDSTGLNTALMLGGENMDRFKTNIDAVKKSSADASGNVKNWSDVQDTLNQQIADFEGAASSLAVKIGRDLLPAVTGFFKDMNDSAKNAKNDGMDLGSVFDNADKFFRNLTDDINNMPVPKGGLFGALFNNSDPGFNEFTKNFADGFDNLFGPRWDEQQQKADAAYQKAMDKASAAGLAVGARFADGIYGTTPQVTDAMGKLVQGIEGPAGLLTGTFYNDGKMISSSFVNGFADSLPDAAAASQGLVDHLQGPLDVLNNGIDGQGKKTGNNFVNGVASAIPLAGSTGTQLGGAIAGALNGLPTVTYGEGKDASGRFNDGLLNPLPTVQSTGNSMAGKISGPLSSLPGMAWQWGNSIGANLAGALWGQANVVGGAAAGIAASIRARFPSSPAKEGPLSGQGSPDILGRNIGRMVSEGITSTNGMVSGSMNNLVNFGRGSYSVPSVGRSVGVGGGTGNITIALYIDGKEIKNGVQKAILREERVNVNNGQSIRTGIR